MLSFTSLIMHACKSCQRCTADGEFVIIIVRHYATNWVKLNKLGRVQTTELRVCERVTDKSETSHRLDKFSAQDLLETLSQTTLRQDRCSGIWAFVCDRVDPDSALYTDLIAYKKDKDGFDHILLNCSFKARFTS